MAAYKDSKNQVRGFSLTLGIIEQVHNRLGVDLLNFPFCFAGIKRMELLRILWRVQESEQSFSDWFQDHKGEGFERVAQAFTVSLNEFLPELNDSRPRRQNTQPINVRQEAYKMAGILGIDCKGMTLRELLWMVEGKFPELQDSQPTNDGGSLQDLCIAMGGRVEE